MHRCVPSPTEMLQHGSVAFLLLKRPTGDKTIIQLHARRLGQY